MEPNYKKVIIIDDEADGRDIIALLLEQNFPDLQLDGSADGVSSGLALISRVQPDIIFLDVEMPDGKAFDLLQACPGLQAAVILVTAYDQYALQAIKASVLDYLLKPVSRDEFVQAVHKALKTRHTGKVPDWSALLENVNRHLTVRKIRIPTLNGFSLVNTDDIVRCEASGNYTIISFTDQSRITASQNLGEYETELRSYGFIRIHHKHLININYIQEYNKGKKGGGFVTLKSRETLEVSSRRRAALFQAFEK